ncbi:MAG: carboxylesterase family protein [Ruminococcus sp.]
MSEDCLYLNVMTTEDSLSSTSRKKPVYVWFHGGATEQPPSTFEPEGNGGFCKERNQAVVTVEQRLGVSLVICHCRSLARNRARAETMV